VTVYFCRCREIDPSVDTRIRTSRAIVPLMFR
jgi:hypothetical protein